ncbi:DUF6082 family protein [Actinomadura formosensis]|uniref:DUF6082 family protein n=1 Tax=Actinomadura formosensis TaxID=60706 RepID=UPI0008319935|nr:DUF6082 family protein [Actinomadura formosensis]
MARTRFTGGGGRRTGQTVLLVLLIVLAAGLVGASPVALGLFQGDATRWERLSFIGQTYGAASALLSAFALAGIVVTLVLQARDTKVNREQGQRLAHLELLKMALDNPLYRRAWGPLPSGHDTNADLQEIYVNLIFSNWQMSFELKTMDERLLRVVASTLFKGEPARRFWAKARRTRIATSATRRERRFHRIVDEMYQAAEAQGPPLPDLGRQRESAIRRHRGVLLGAALGAAVALLAHALHRGIRAVPAPDGREPPRESTQLRARARR